MKKMKEVGGVREIKLMKVVMMLNYEIDGEEEKHTH
jgi:hypothetical protein